MPTTSPSWSLRLDRKSTRLNSSHLRISYAVFCLKKKTREARLGLVLRGECVAAEGRSARTGSAYACPLNRPRARHTELGRRSPPFFFFFKNPAPPEIYPFSLPHALPI